MSGKQKHLDEEHGATVMVPNDIAPKFAMVAPGWFKEQGNKDLLAIGHGDGRWEFQLDKHLKRIQEENPHSDFYLVGYRNEERPVIKDIHQDSRVVVPYMVVHAVPQGEAPPKYVVVSDREKKLERFIPMVTLPLNWQQAAIFSSTKQKVMMMESTARRTARSLSTETNECSGGHLWFADKVNYELNPVEDFVFECDGEVFYFPDDAWYNTRGQIKGELKRQGVNWEEFCLWDVQPWLGTLLPVALDKLFEYEEDFSRERYEAQVSEKLADVFYAFKKKQEADESLYAEYQEMAEHSKHYKIYPENECLKPYLAGGDCFDISKWCGKAEAVFPKVSPMPKEQIGTDIWGNPLPSGQVL